MFHKSQFFHNLHKLFQCISSINTKILILKYHKIAVIWPCLRLPLTTRLQFHYAIAVVSIIALKFNQHLFPSLCHNHKIGIMVDVPVELETLSVNNMLPPPDVSKPHRNVNQILFLLVHIVPLGIV